MALAALVVMLVAACDNDKPGESPDPQPTGSAPAADFAATVTRVTGGFTIAYRFTNRSGADLIALNRVPYDRGTPPDAVYVTGRGAGHVQIAKRAFDQPASDRMGWAAFAQIGGTLVTPGQTVGETFSVPAPLHRVFPYGNDFGYGEITLPDPIDDLTFCLGVIPLPAKAPAGLMVTHSTTTTRAQHLYCTAPAKP